MTFQTIGRTGLATFLSTARQGLCVLSGDFSASAFLGPDRSRGGTADRRCSGISDLHSVYRGVFEGVTGGQFGNEQVAKRIVNIRLINAVHGNHLCAWHFL